jgi:hypothetical protein
LAAVAGLAVIPASGLALRVTVGTPSARFGNGMSVSTCSSCTQFQTAAPGFTLAVPADGVITTWRVAGRGPLALRVLRPSAGGLVAVATRAAPSFAASSVASFPVNLPVLAGDRIGVDLLPAPARGPVAQLRFTPLEASAYGQVQPAVPDGAPVSAGGSGGGGGALSLNADVEIAPVAAGLDVGSGPTTGATAVSIDGSYLDGVTQVLFGGAPAPFSLGAAGQLLVTTPARTAPGPVDVVVRGPGGSSTLHGAFTYLAPQAPGSPPGSPGTPGARPGAPGGARAPVPALTGLSLSPSAFLAAPSGPVLAAARSGTRLAYSDSQAATTRFEVLRLVPGRLVPAGGSGARRCQPARRPVPGTARCTAALAVGPVFGHDDRAGLNVLRFTGRLGGRALAAGSYRLRAVATDALGRGSPPVTHAFRIIAPRPRR